MRPGVIGMMLVAGVLALSAQAGGGRTLTPGIEKFVTVDSAIVALTDVRLVDGTGGPAREAQTIVVSGDRIQAVGPAASTTVPAGARVIDLAGHTVIPGLVSLHEHTYFGGVKRVTEMRVSGPLLYLAHGVTTAMTAGSQLPYHELNLKRAIDTGATPGPRLFITGPYLNGDGGTSGMSRNVSNAEELRRVTRCSSR